MACVEHTARVYVNMPTEEVLAYTQRDRPEGYISAALYVHVFFHVSPFTKQIGPRTAVAVFVGSPRRVEEEPIFAYLCVASPYLLRECAGLLRADVCSPRMTWVKVSCVNGTLPIVVPFAKEVSLSCHTIDPSEMYAPPRGSVARFVEWVAHADADFWVFSDHEP